ncbi:RND superfamily NFE family efflux transporter inner membrane pump subunit [Oleiphilus messinensis]|uniref:RND superfamily NFE family efflux transporter inner membrane pump subunit n=1 Tax=Oleiphilus messinensis TaxID=141451 RepID=A0A1Y0IAZ1_9GAMM|nr:efflux RND transporter permease subunit [Oleiphilus messinensis]ARU57420.1 RND superfamily NFE family efflux transporter inner membrane pump subunit [Oleiphilus messinensis]
MNTLISWFTHHRVAANLLMFTIVVLGLLALPDTRKELLPNVSLERISIAIAYPGATAEEVERAICTRIENNIYDLEGLLDLTALATEGLCSVTVDVAEGFETDNLLEEIKSRIESLNTLPDGSERALIKELQVRNRVAKLIIAGQAAPSALKKLAEGIRNDLLKYPEISIVDIENVRPYEISIEVNDRLLNRYNLSFDTVVKAIESTSVNMPGGTLKTPQGDILIQTTGKIAVTDEFAKIVLWADNDGGRISLADVATVKDGFQRGENQARLDGVPSVSVDIYRVGNQDITAIAQRINDYVSTPDRYIPDEITLSIWKDDSKLFKGRIDLLLSNALTGLLLLMLVLLLFLSLRMSFWISVGIPVAFMGAFWLLPVLGGSINLISLFAFLLVLGIVVDDAVVVGESIHQAQTPNDQKLTNNSFRQEDPINAAIKGAQNVAKPLTFAVLTSIIAFLPLLFLPGPEGKLMEIIPIVVITTLVFSLVESLLILPVHLSASPSSKAPEPGRIQRWQMRFAKASERFVDRHYRPFLNHALHWRWSYLTLFVALFMFSITLVVSGWIQVVLFSSIDADIATAEVAFAEGTPAEETSRAIRQIENAALTLQQELADSQNQSPIIRVFSVIGPQDKISNATQLPNQDHRGRVSIELSSSDNRLISSNAIVQAWREKVGAIENATELKFSADLITPKPDINIELSGDDFQALKHGAEQLKQSLAQYPGVYDIRDSQQSGKPRVEITLKPTARDLNLTLQDVGYQVHSAFHGVEVQNIQRGEQDVKVLVRYPETETLSLWHLENMRIQLPSQTAQNSGVPLITVANVSYGPAAASIKRYERRRVVSVTAYIDPSQSAPREVMTQLEQTVLTQLTQDGHLKWSKAGKQKSIGEFITILSKGYLLALIGMYLVMAILFSSYSQPLLIMFAIPFGLVGALSGHLLLGIDLTLWSLIGMVAVSGVVVNDTLVLVDYINQKRAEGLPLQAAIAEAGVKRFRPIMLTSLTTFAGLTPLIMESSIQAQFLIPMAVSMAFGVMFATLISLILVPAIYMMLNDLTHFIQQVGSRHLDRHKQQTPNDQLDNVDTAYQFGYQAGLNMRHKSKRPRATHNPYRDEVLSSGWEAGYYDGQQASCVIDGDSAIQVSSAET